MMSDSEDDEEIVFDKVFEAAACDHLSGAIIKRLISYTDVVYLYSRERKKPKTSWQRFINTLLDCRHACNVFCCPPCPPCIIHKMAFVSRKSSYRFVAFGPPKNGDYRVWLEKHAANDFCAAVCPGEGKYRLFRGFYVGSKRKRIACVFCPWSWLGYSSARITLLFSHSNGDDLGYMLPRIEQLCCKLRVNVVAYDYSGYGCSGGSCSEQRLYENAEQVYEFMIKNMKIPCTRIVSVGTSLGTAATIHLASKRQVGGVILQGSFASAIRAVNPDTEETVCIDRFVNVDRIHKVKAPTLFVHGRRDHMFGVEHVMQLRRRCPGATKFQPLIIERGEHADFENHEEYWPRLLKFIHEELPGNNSGSSSSSGTKKT